jgi:hypothetical protein
MRGLCRFAFWLQSLASEVLALWHFDTSLSPKVLKFDGPSKDGRRHRRGTYLFSVKKAFQKTKWVDSKPPVWLSQAKLLAVSWRPKLAWFSHLVKLFSTTVIVNVVHVSTNSKLISSKLVRLLGAEKLFSAFVERGNGYKYPFKQNKCVKLRDNYNIIIIQFNKHYFRTHTDDLSPYRITNTSAECCLFNSLKAWKYNTTGPI